MSSPHRMSGEFFQSVVRRVKSFRHRQKISSKVVDDEVATAILSELLQSSETAVVSTLSCDTLERHILIQFEIHAVEKTDQGGTYSEAADIRVRFC